MVRPRPASFRMKAWASCATGFAADFVMQPLSRVKPGRVLSTWGGQIKLSTRPQVAAKVADCIASWSNIEQSLCFFLSMLLHASENAITAMLAATESRAAQLRMIEAAAMAEMPQNYYDSFSVMLTSQIRPAMKERDKLAHWCWGVSDELPDDLLIMKPSETVTSQLEAIKVQAVTAKPLVRIESKREIFVVTAGDMDRTYDRFEAARESLRCATGMVWVKNTPQERDQAHVLLLQSPQIRSGLEALNASRQKKSESQPPSPAPEPSGGM